MATLVRDAPVAALGPDADLSSWVREHRVTWEIAPWQEMSEHHVVPVGFEVRLFARYREGRWPDPGGSEGASLYEKLRSIALAVLPKEHRPTRYEIEPFDVSFHLRPESAWTPEVQLSLHIEHRDGYFQPVDECERRCVAEIQRGLTALGLQPKSWSAARPAE